MPVHHDSNQKERPIFLTLPLNTPTIKIAIILSPLESIFLDITIRKCPSSHFQFVLALITQNLCWLIPRVCYLHTTHSSALKRNSEITKKKKKKMMPAKQLEGDQAKTYGAT